MNTTTTKPSECSICCVLFTYSGNRPYRLVHIENSKSTTHPDLICNDCVKNKYDKYDDGVFYCPLCNEKVEKGTNFEFEEDKDLISELKIQFEAALKEKEIIKHRKKSKKEFLQQFQSCMKQISSNIKIAGKTNNISAIIEVAKNCLTALTCSNIGMLSEIARKNRDALLDSKEFIAWKFYIMPECYQFFMDKLPTLKSSVKSSVQDDGMLCYCYAIMVFGLIRYCQYNIYLDQEHTEYCNVVYECFQNIERLLIQHPQLNLPFMPQYLYFFGQVILDAVDFVPKVNPSFLDSLRKDSKKNVEVDDRRAMIDKAMKMIRQSADLFQDPTVKNNVLSIYALHQFNYNCTTDYCGIINGPIKILRDCVDFSNFDNNNLNQLHLFLTSFSCAAFLNEMKEALPLLELAANMGSLLAQLKLFKIFRCVRNKIKFSKFDINVVAQQFSAGQIEKYSSMDYLMKVFKSGYLGAFAFVLQEYLQDEQHSVFFGDAEMKLLTLDEEKKENENVFEYCYSQLSKYIYEHVDQTEYEEQQPSVEFYKKKLSRIAADAEKWARTQHSTTAYAIYPRKIQELQEIKRIYFVVAKYFFNNKFTSSLISLSVKKIKLMYNCLMLAAMNEYQPALRHYLILTDSSNPLHTKITGMRDVLLNMKSVLGDFADKIKK